MNINSVNLSEVTTYRFGGICKNFISIESEDDLSDDEVEGETIDCTYEGVAYTRNSKDEVFDDDFELVGSWVNGAIKFTTEGLVQHANNPDRC